MSCWNALSPRSAVEKSPDNIVDDAGLQTDGGSVSRGPVLASHAPPGWHATLHPGTSRTAPCLPIHRMASLCPGLPPGMKSIGAFCSLPPVCRANRYLRVRAEDALNDTQSQLLAIAAWLGIRGDEDALEAHAAPGSIAFCPARSGRRAAWQAATTPGFCTIRSPRTSRDARQRRSAAGLAGGPVRMENGDRAGESTRLL